MTKINIILLSVLGIVVLFFIVKLPQNKVSQITTKNSFPQNNPIAPKKDKFSSQKNEGGNVTITVQPEVLKIGLAPKFKIEFNTHTVDLSFDIARQSYLVNDKGNRLNDSVWRGSPPGGHHRNGTLTFNPPLSQTKYVRLIIADVADVKERKFHWNL